MRPVVVIPARMGSTRFPGKPMALIGGIPMIVHVARRARQADIGPVVVACDDPEVMWAVLELAEGAGAMLTGPATSGTARVAEVMARLDPAHMADVVINLQGDLPTIEPDDLRRVLEPLDERLKAIGTLVAPLEPGDGDNPSVVKAVVEASGHVARWSRGPIAPAMRHVGVYAFRRRALTDFAAAAPSKAERKADLEQHRASVIGWPIYAETIRRAPPSVDTPADLERVEALIAAGG